MVGAAKYGTLEEQHNALSDLPGPKSGQSGVLNKIEAYLVDANHLNKKDLARKTPFFSKDQRDHIVEEVKTYWALRKPYTQGNYRVEPQLREGKKNISLQYSFRNMQTGKFERPRRIETEESQDGA